MRSRHGRIKNDLLPDVRSCKADATNDIDLISRKWLDMFGPFTKHPREVARTVTTPIKFYKKGAWA